jgi:hypothetical protein
VAIRAVAGVTPPSPVALARAIDHDQPIANNTRRRIDAALKTLSPVPDGFVKPRGRDSGKARSFIAPVDLRF